MEELIVSAAVIGSGIALVLAIKTFPRTKGKRIEYHIAYFVSCALILFFVPDFVQNVFFSHAGVLVLGTIIPIYQSIKAIVSIDKDDDVAWLQFWLASGVFRFSVLSFFAAM